MSDAGSDSRPIFRARTAITLILVGIFAFSAFVTLLAYAPDLDRDSSCRANVYSRCAIGFAGLAEAVKQGGATTLVSRGKFPKGRTQGLLIVTPEPGRGADVGKLAFSGPILVVLPKWEVSRHPTHMSWGRKERLIPAELMPKEDLLDVVSVARAKGVGRPRLTGAAGTPFEGVTLMAGPIASLQTLSANGWTPVLTDGAGNVVLAQAAGSRIFVLADPDLLNTQGLADLDTFAAAVTLLRTLRIADGPVIFDVSLNGYKSERSALRLMFDPPFLAVTLCFVAAVALAGLQAAFRFGPVRRPQRALALGKEALTDNSAQLIRIARREPNMAPGYAALAQKAAARAVGAPRELTGDALTRFLDRMGAQRGLTDTLADLTAEAGHVAGRSGLTALAARLYRWRLEMTRERQ
ncbi:MAG TPA: hypothetical protein VFE13_00520 [Caulobacteraceae bacterium]|nr:hypothetical protein [Caulobacteraceae bacterium]